MDADKLAAPAPAKINLFLHVTGRRADGYHELDSLVVFADVGDRLEVAPADELTLEITGPRAAELDAGPDNLVMRAAMALATRLGAMPGARMRLEKNLPVASGIGGGSADAACAIKLLARLWGAHPGQHDLSGLALELGADVPVCLYGRPARMGGIGERVEAADGVPDLPAVLVNPGVHVATPAVFKARQGGFSAPASFADMPADRAGWIAALAGCRNDLEAPAMALAPAVTEVLDALAATGGVRLRRMSGSGATCFALYDDMAAAEAAAARLRDAHPDWWVMAATFNGSGT
ncbi:MAG: 4-(cytidine 5'-diphospho)-2-C-methyl-D-erythritol kinase [Rhodospirillaceae bacterium]